MLSLIVAVSQNGVIGKDGKMPWHFPEDLRYFKQRTTGHTLILGGNTCRSLGKPLPNRQNIMVTRAECLPGFYPADCINAALQLAYQTDPDPIIAGGSQIYAQSLALCERAWITVVPSNPDGDTFFCGLGSNWTLQDESVSEAGLRYQTWARD